MSTECFGPSGTRDGRSEAPNSQTFSRSRRDCPLLAELGVGLQQGGRLLYSMFQTVARATPQLQAAKSHAEERMISGCG